MKHIVTHDPSTNSFLVHEPKKEPVKTFKYEDAEDRDEARAKANAHADKLSNQSNEGTNMKKTYAEFIAEMNEWNAGDFVKAAQERDKAKKTSKGTKYTGAEADTDNDDDDDTKKHAEPEVKRGRGRPAGSKSGARSKGRDGGSSGGTGEYHLSLPTKSVYY